MSSLKYEIILEIAGKVITSGGVISEKTIRDIADEEKLILSEVEVAELKKITTIFHRKIKSKENTPTNKERKKLITEILYPEKKEEIEKEISQENKPERNNLKKAIKALEEEKPQAIKLPQIIARISEDYELSKKEKEELKLFARKMSTESKKEKKGGLDAAFKELEEIFLNKGPIKMTTTLIEEIAFQYNVEKKELIARYKKEKEILAEKWRKTEVIR